MKPSNTKPSTSAGAITAAVTTVVAYLAGLDWDLTQVDWSIAINWILGLTGVGGLVGYVTSDKETAEVVDQTLPLGIRNNNPGNLRPSNRYKWRGEIGENRGFVVFDSDTHGLRAMARNLRNQTRLHGLDTLAGILRKYAPDNENDTQAYIEYVSKKSGFRPDERINLEFNSTLVTLMVPMIRMENGQQPYSTEKLIEAVELA